MRRIKRFNSLTEIAEHACWLFILLIGGVAQAQEGEEVGRTKMPEVICEGLVVTLPEPLAQPLLPDLRDPEKIETALDVLRRMIREKRAVLVSSPWIVTLSGHRTVFQEISERRYPQEFRTSLIANEQRLEVKSRSSPPTVQVHVAALDVVTHNFGVTLELEPNVSPDRTIIDVNGQFKDVREAGKNPMALCWDADKRVIAVDQPVFYTISCGINARLRPNEWRLMGVYQQAVPPKQTELLLLKFRLPHPPESNQLK
jgi:hypothetical protein